MTVEAALRTGIVRVCVRLAERGLIAGPDGNVSARLPDGRLLITPSGMSKGDVREADLAVLDADGNFVSGPCPPSSEKRMHVRIFQRRPDVHAVVHAHPPTATGFAVAGEDFLAPVLPELILQMGGVPLIPYATPGSDALADEFEPFLPHHDAFLMANHGATTVGPSLLIAHQRMESLEHGARILLAARQLGRVRPLAASDADVLHAAWRAARRGGER
ncbi:MAG TPA: class II aldolase/adducin family protein [Gemmatimonadaceae bacterium]|jgi:L-fuculose-phosphate aldolase|nr:class II aldolase/adducin family protein [Gemmatimonadaceae bacterium]